MNFFETNIYIYIYIYIYISMLLIKKIAGKSEKKVNLQHAVLGVGLGDRPTKIWRDMRFRYRAHHGPGLTSRATGHGLTGRAHRSGIASRAWWDHDPGLTSWTHKPGVTSRDRENGLTCWVRWPGFTRWGSDPVSPDAPRAWSIHKFSDVCK